MECFRSRVGAKYEVNALFQLLDSEGVPYACDKTAAWADPMYCILMTIEYLTNVGERKRRHVGNNYGGAWIAEDFNSFTSRFTITQEIADSQSAFFFFHGPPAGASIIFDHVTITEIVDTVA